MWKYHGVKITRYPVYTNGKARKSCSNSKPLQDYIVTLSNKLMIAQHRYSFENRERSCEYTERCKLLVLMFVRCIAMTWIAFCRVWIVCMSTTFRRLDAIKQKNTCNKCESSCNVCEAKKNPIAKFCKVLVRAQLVRANCERGLNDTYPLNRFCSIHPCHHLNMKKQQ